MCSPPTAETLRATMQIARQFDYEVDTAKLRNLYSKSKRSQWDAEVGWAVRAATARRGRTRAS
jgi:hypothetical protein